MNMQAITTGHFTVAAARRRGAQAGRWRSAGFTLIEVMMVVVIMGILAAIAFSSYTRQVARTHRVAAEGCLSQAASYMERYYTTYMRYDQTGSSASATANTLPQLDCMTTSQTGLEYDYSLSSLSASTYQLNAKPKGMQATRDVLCGTLSLNQAGARSPSTTGCW